MSVPDFQTFMLPVRKLFAGGATNVAQCLPALKEQFAISEEEASELIPSGRMTVLASRAHWARTYLGKAGLLESPRRNVHIITEKGRRVLATEPASININALESFE
jgi:restriction system protein